MRNEYLLSPRNLIVTDASCLCRSFSVIRNEPFSMVKPIPLKVPTGKSAAEASHGMTINAEIKNLSARFIFIPCD